jgi:hypothetical protein
MKRLLGENASGGLKSAIDLGHAAARTGGGVCAAAGEERSEKASCPAAFVARDSQFLLEIDVRVEKYYPM